MNGSIYCDMDQVLVNFLAGARRALGREFNDPALGTDHQKWIEISKIHHFWINLDWMPGAEILWNRIKNYDTYILSAAPKPEDNPSCAPEKTIWCRQQLGVDQTRVLIVQRNEKQKFAKTNGHPNLLIDDHPHNVNDWLLAGGLAIYHTSIPETLRELSKYGL